MKSCVILCAIVAVFSSLPVIRGLQCLQCFNAKSNWECQRRGRMVTCEANENACHNSIRINGEGNMLITKTCKQAAACNSNFLQNPKPAWSPVQCNMRHHHTVCRCCCYEDSCNYLNSECPNDCYPLKAPRNGAVSCNYQKRATEIDATCHFTCARGYRMSGRANTQCVRKGLESLYNNPPPLCIRTSCSPMKAPFNGAVHCSDYSNHNSVCNFRCNLGFGIVGASTSTCRWNNDWSRNRPLCRSIRCNPKMAGLLDGYVWCSNLNVVGSVCSFACNAGFQLDGPDRVTCNDDGDFDQQGVWSGYKPQCVRATGPTCRPQQYAPFNGQVVCTDQGNLGSVCAFGCFPGFGLVGAAKVSCDISARGGAAWSSLPPTCDPIACPSLDNFDVMSNCTLDNNLDSECEFECDVGIMEGYSNNFCADAGDGTAVGVWTPAVPVCIRPKCVDGLGVPLNGGRYEKSGDARCLATGNMVGNECHFWCDSGYVMAGQEYVVCEPTCDDEGFLLGTNELCSGEQNGTASWSSKAPECLAVHCFPERSDPDNGAVSCTNGNFDASVCTYSCNLGFVVTGEPSMTCLDDTKELLIGVWSNDPAICEPVHCATSHVNPAHGTVSCSNGDNYLSVCTFECPEENHMIRGSATSTCLHDGGPTAEWDHEAPTCVKRDCPSLPDIPEHGTRVCTALNDLGSVCTLGCQEYYSLSGSTTSTCVKNADGSMSFDNPSPTCFAMECPEQAPLLNGSSDCSLGNQVTSLCQFTCRDGFVNFPASRLENSCILREDGSYGWNAPAPCCALPCPPNAVIDLVIAVDVTGDRRSVKIVQDFAVQLFEQFIVSDTDVEVGFTLFNNEVAQSVILFSSFDNIESVKKAIDTIVVGQFRGKPVMHDLYLNSFQDWAGDRADAPNVAIVVVQDALNDPKAIASATKWSNTLREDGTKILAVGAGASPEVLAAITGGDEALTFSSTILGLPSLIEEVSTSLCSNSCS